MAMLLLTLLGMLLVVETPRIVSGRNSLAKTPPMGWMSWELFRQPGDITEQLYMAQADALVAGGYIDAGYTGVHIDDCWSEKSRDPKSGALRPNASRFPNLDEGQWPRRKLIKSVPHLSYSCAENCIAETNVPSKTQRCTALECDRETVARGNTLAAGNVEQF